LSCGNREWRAATAPNSIEDRIENRFSAKKRRKINAADSAIHF
jgi:hypothetical protein